MASTLASKLAVVTGAGSGIGRATAIKLSEAGAYVACCDWNGDAATATAQLITDKFARRCEKQDTYLGHVPSVGFECDVSNASMVEETFETIRDVFGGQPATLLANCAGITRDNFLWKVDEDMWDAVMSVNLKGTFLTTKYLAKGVMEANTELLNADEGALKLSASIVNISSIVGKTGNLGQTNYAASKAGVVGLTKAAAKDLARHGIRVNAIQPGFIVTPMTDAVPQKVMDVMLGKIPMSRFGQPEEIADAIEFLMSDRSSYMTGNVLEVAGGLDC